MDAATCTTSAFDNCRAFFMKQLNNYHHFAKSKVHDKPQFLNPVFRLTRNSLHTVWKLSKMSHLTKINFKIHTCSSILKKLGWIGLVRSGQVSQVRLGQVVRSGWVRLGRLGQVDCIFQHSKSQVRLGCVNFVRIARKVMKMRHLGNFQTVCLSKSKS